MAHRFHIEKLPEVGRVNLPAGVARHLGVLGLGVGSEVVLFDGSGREARARITAASPARAEAETLGAAEVSREAGVAVTLATAVPKGRRMDVLVRMCAELGVARIVPLITRRSVVRLPDGDERSGKLLRWRKIALAASEQSGRNRLTEISPARSLRTLLAGDSRGHTPAAPCNVSVLLTPDDAAPALPALLAGHRGAESILLILGPEGGFTDDELALAKSSGALPARLTRSILRIETACVVAAATALMYSEPNTP